VLALLVIGSAPLRGIAGALAGLTKFGPLALAPLLLRGSSPSWPRKRSVVAYTLTFAVTLVAAMLPVLLENNLHAFWSDTIAYQADRTTPFSIWGLWGGLGLEQHLVEGAAVALAIAVAFVPRRRGPVEIAALAGAVIIAVQLAANYWLYSYIVWFLPPVLMALFAAYPTAAAVQEEARDRLDVTWASAPVPAGSPTPASAPSP
jgi:hypothetical protein